MLSLTSNSFSIKNSLFFYAKSLVYAPLFDVDENLMFNQFCEDLKRILPNMGR